MLDKLTPVILAGGQGLRLRPFTSQSRPKPLLKVASLLTLVQETLKRCEGMAPPIIICDEQWAETMLAQCEEIEITPRIIIAEPCARSTAPAIAAAALGMKPEEMMIVMPSDHIIENTDAFRNSVKAVLACMHDMHKNAIISLGVAPKAPSNRYGYIQKGSTINEYINQSLGFIEKPDQEKAQDMIKSGQYVWNSGIFITKSEAIIQNFKTFSPNTLKNINKSPDTMNKHEKIMLLDELAYQKNVAAPIDTEILEKYIHMYVANIQSDWRDIGAIKTFLWVWIKRLFAIITE